MTLIPYKCNQHKTQSTTNKPSSSNEPNWKATSRQSHATASTCMSSISCPAWKAAMCAANKQAGGTYARQE